MKTVRFISILFTLLLLAQSAFSFGKKDSSDSPEASATEKSAKQEKKEEIQKDHINIDFLFDTKEANPKNRFNWSTSSANSAAPA